MNYTTVLILKLLNVIVTFFVRILQIVHNSY